MNTIMTVDELCDMFVEERDACSANWYIYKDKENKALMVGDHGTAVESRRRANHARERYKEVDNILKEIYKKKNGGD